MKPQKFKIAYVTPTKNFYRVVFADSLDATVCRTPSWALGISESISKGSQVVMCIFKGEWRISSVLITRKFHDTNDARRLALRIAKKIRETDKKVPKKWAGGSIEGPSHDEGGVTLELQGGEGVLMREVMMDMEPKIYSGTNREIVHQMQREHGGNPMMEYGGNVDPAESWVEVTYQDADGIDWAKDRLIEDKVRDVFEDAGINCISGNCLIGSGITIDSQVRDIVFYVPLDQKEEAVEAIKEEFKDLNIPSKEMKVRSEITSMKKGGIVGSDRWIQKVDKEMEKRNTIGKFTRKALRNQMIPVNYAKKVLKDPKNYSKTTVKEAQFIKNVNPEKFAA